MTTLPPGECGVAMVFQSYALYPHMSVADNITYSGDGTLVINQAIAYDGVTLGVVRVTLDNQQIHERQDAAKVGSWGGVGWGG